MNDGVYEKFFCVRMIGLDSSHTILMKLNVDNVVDLLK